MRARAAVWPTLLLGNGHTFPFRVQLVDALSRPELFTRLLGWIGPELVPLDPELRALLEPHRSKPEVAAVLDAKPKKAMKKKKR